MAITLTAIPDPTYSPPRVRLTFQDTATTPVPAVEIYRRDPDGRSRKVRTSDDGPLVVSGGLASVDDYEAPFSVPATYTITGQTATATTQLDVTVPWLIHVGVPSLSVSVRVQNIAERVRVVDQAVFRVLGRSMPIVATGGARDVGSSVLTVRTDTDEQRRALDQLLDDAAPLFFNLPPSKRWGIAPCYIAVGDTTEARFVNYGSYPRRDWDLPFQVVDRPAGGTQAGITWDSYATRGVDDYTAEVGSQYTTWAAMAAAVQSWSDLADPAA